MVNRFSTGEDTSQIVEAVRRDGYAIGGWHTVDENGMVTVSPPPTAE